MSRLEVALGVFGACLVVVGVAMAYLPLAFVLAGAALVGLVAIDWED